MLKSHRSKMSMSICIIYIYIYIYKKGDWKISFKADNSILPSICYYFLDSRYYMYTSANDSLLPLQSAQWFLQARTLIYAKNTQGYTDRYRYIDVYENTSSVCKISKLWSVTYEILLIFNSACGLLIEVSTDLLVEHK